MMDKSLQVLIVISILTLSLTSAQEGGCTFRDDQIQAGERLVVDDCTTCYCDGAQAKCDIIACDFPRCGYPVKLEGQCCPVCPQPGGCVAESGTANSCQNRGTCLDRPGALPEPACVCRTFYRGEFCQIGTTCDNNPCLNGGTCTRDASADEGYVCECPEGYQGINCQGACFFRGTAIQPEERYVVDDCTTCYCDGAQTKCDIIACDFPRCGYPVKLEGQCCPVCPQPGGCVAESGTANSCQNRGTCLDRPGALPEPACVCRTFYRGQFCQIGTSCDNNPCLNGGTCTSDASADEGYVCECPEGYQGINCQGACFFRGTAIQPEERYVVDNCITCYCDENVTKCDIIACAKPECDDPVTPEGQCCPICPACFFREQPIQADERFPVDDCTTCYCDEGVTKCDIQSCPQSLDCEDTIKIDGQCCPVCGACSFRNKPIQAGERLAVDDCITCYCDGNITKCDIIACATPQCDDPVTPEGQCCPICPACFFRKQPIQADERFPVDDCTTCYCDEGVTKCDIQSCPQSLDCEDTIKIDGQCCPVCGACSFRDKPIQAGERFVVDDCVTCYCDGNITKCDIISCPTPDCEDPVKLEGQCCLVCPQPGGCVLDYGTANSCQNNGTCLPIPAFPEPTCICKRAFSGKYCEIGLDGCSKDPCQNGATCSDDRFAPEGYVCLCTEGYRGNNCEEIAPCPSTQFTCANDNCLDFAQRCDGNDDCMDNSDEEDCVVCDLEEQYRCQASNKCIPKSYQCDWENDCGDNQDEIDGCVCNENREFECDTGGCIRKAWLCDRELDCYDGSDESVENCDIERGCTTEPDQDNSCLNGGNCRKLPLIKDRICICKRGYRGNLCQIEIDSCSTDPCENGGTCVNILGGYNCLCAKGWEGLSCQEQSCPANMTKCANGKCINSDWYCDGFPDCKDESDELKCCPDTQFNCANGICLEWDQWCNGKNDCRDNSDEDGCAECGKDEYRCRTNICIPNDRRCDWTNDCNDNSDENVGCECKLEYDEEWECDDHSCINGTWVCDGEPDCYDGSDELAEYCECSADQWKCQNGLCIPYNLLCDGTDNCFDNSDELNCTAATTCPENKTACADGECIYSDWHCDGFPDCKDESDEQKCCPDSQYNCANGVCIEWDQWCDGTDNCRDNSDEDGCTECGADEYRCHSNICIPSKYRCDYLNDCIDNSDENVGCECELDYDKEWECDDHSCINGTWWCDGEEDCYDGSDELPEYCECPPDTWECQNGICVEYHLLCDGIDHCYDNSDELNCDRECEADEFTCDNGRCIRATYRCDYLSDCTDNSDEIGCECELDYDVEWECDDLSCINGTWLCDGEEDCFDGSDESDEYCDCPSDTQWCADRFLCVPFTYLCDGNEDCYDGSDEQNCTAGSFCQYNEHMCPEELCISSSWVCDGIADCSDDSDESTELCSTCPYQFLCTNDRCAPANDLCNGRDRCGDNSDEDQICVDLPVPTVVQVFNHFITLNWAEPPPQLGTAIPRSITQYAVVVTPQGGRESQTHYFPARADEDFIIRELEPETTYDVRILAVIDTEGQGEYAYDLGAEPLTATTTASMCPKVDQFYCEESIYGISCLPDDWLCDKVPDCVDGSDERRSECCAIDEMICDNFRCVSSDAKCDGNNDCGDFSDEVDCNGGIENE